MPLLPSRPGIYFEASKLLDQSSALSPIEFASWGENTHVPAVQATGSISHTWRYESLSFMRRHRSNGKGKEMPENINFNYDFLTIFYMPHLSSRDDDEFKVVIGEVEPSGEDSKLLERLLMQTEFDMRFCEQAQGESKMAKTAPPFLVTVGAPASHDMELKFGDRVASKYTGLEMSLLSAYERIYPQGHPTKISIFGCNSMPDLSGLKVDRETSLGSLEIGIWGLRREYNGSEKKPAHWRPNVRI